LYAGFGGFYMKYLGLPWERNIMTYGASALSVVVASIANRYLMSGITVEKLDQLIENDNIKTLRKKWYLFVATMAIITVVIITMAIKK
jgi:hypothetical protein